MLNHLVTWFRTETREGQRCWARWIGRNWARLNYATRVEPTWLELNCHHVPVRDLPQPFAGLKIVQLSDLHLGGRVTPKYLNEAVDLALAQRGDLVVLTGDFIHKGHKHVEQVAHVLKRLSAPLGVFAVLGNHDFSVRNASGIRRYRNLHTSIADALTANGVRVLRNETVPLVKDGARLNLTGVDDLWSRVCDLDKAFSGLCSAVPRVVLAHNPRTIEQLGGARCDLMLSGHTHGGQVSIPGLGPVTLGANVRRFAAGMYVFRNTYLYVNKGVGFGFPMRFGVRPEVAVLSLQPAADAPPPKLELPAGV